MEAFLSKQIDINKNKITELQDNKKSATVSEVGFLIEGRYQNEREYLLRKAAIIKKENDDDQQTVFQLQNTLSTISDENEILKRELVLKAPAEQSLLSFQNEVSERHNQRLSLQTAAKHKLQLLKLKLTEYENELKLVNAKISELSSKQQNLLLCRDEESKIFYSNDAKGVQSYFNPIVSSLFSLSVSHETHSKDLIESSHVSSDILEAKLREFKIKEIETLNHIKCLIENIKTSDFTK